jgi:hypothetical protein
MNFFDYLPFESMTEDQWAAYAACVVWACSRDGLTSDEEAALNTWLSDNNAADGLLAKATSIASQGIDKLTADLAPGNAVGIYLVRDAFRFAMVDGLGTSEISGIQDLAQKVGVSSSQAAAIRSACECYVMSQRLWRAAQS